MLKSIDIGLSKIFHRLERGTCWTLRDWRGSLVPQHETIDETKNRELQPERREAADLTAWRSTDAERFKRNGISDGIHWTLNAEHERDLKKLLRCPLGSPIEQKVSNIFNLSSCDKKSHISLALFLPHFVFTLPQGFSMLFL